MRITKFQRESEGYFTARVSEEGATVPVHNRHGSWLTDTNPMREVRQDAKEELARRVRAELRKEGKKVSR